VNVLDIVVFSYVKLTIFLLVLTGEPLSWLAEWLTWNPAHRGTSQADVGD